MTYTMQLMDGTRLVITEEEFGKLAGKSGLIAIPSLGQVVNLSSVTRIAKSDEFLRGAPRKEQTLGVLHDGTVCVRQFGRWYVQNGARDDEGKLLTEPSSEHYPEIGYGWLPSPQEYEREFKTLSLPEWRTRLLDAERPQQLEAPRTSAKGFTRIGGQAELEARYGSRVEPLP